jgi:hypothetical protein
VFPLEFCVFRLLMQLHSVAMAAVKQRKASCAVSVDMAAVDNTATKCLPAGNLTHLAGHLLPACGMPFHASQNTAPCVHACCYNYGQRSRLETGERAIILLQLLVRGYFAVSRTTCVTVGTPHVS